MKKIMVMSEKWEREMTMMDEERNDNDDGWNERRYGWGRVGERKGDARVLLVIFALVFFLLF